MAQAEAPADAPLGLAPGVARDTGLARAGVSQSTTACWTFERDVHAYRSEGWGAVGVWLQKLEGGPIADLTFPERILDPTRVDAGVAALADSNLVRSHLHGAGLFVEPDDTVRARRVDHALFAIDTSARLGVRCVVVIPGPLRAVSRKRALDLAASACAEILERSAGSAVGMAIEPVKDIDFITTLDEALDLVELVDHERLGVFPDAFHLWRDPGLMEAIERASGRIFGVHVADSTGSQDSGTRVPPGEGVVELGEFVAAIERTGYTGTYDVELFSLDADADETADLLARCALGMRQILPVDHS